VTGPYGPLGPACAGHWRPRTPAGPNVRCAPGPNFGQLFSHALGAAVPPATGRRNFFFDLPPAGWDGLPQVFRCGTTRPPPRQRALPWCLAAPYQSCCVRFYLPPWGVDLDELRPAMDGEDRVPSRSGGELKECPPPVVGGRWNFKSAERRPTLVGRRPTVPHPCWPRLRPRALPRALDHPPPGAPASGLSLLPDPSLALACLSLRPLLDHLFRRSF